MNSSKVSSSPLSFSDCLPVAGPLLQQRRIRFRIISNSMAPALKAGDLVEVRPTVLKELRPGELVVFSRHGTLICHRLVRWFDQEGKRWAVTKGDGVSGEDPPVPLEEVVGTVARVCRPRSLHRLAWHLKRWASGRLREARWRS